MPHTQFASLEMVTVAHCVSFVPHVHTGSAHVDVCVTVGHIGISKESPIHTLKPTAATSFVPGSPPMARAVPAFSGSVGVVCPGRRGVRAAVPSHSGTHTVILALLSWALLPSGPACPLDGTRTSLCVRGSCVFVIMVGNPGSAP